MTQLKNRCDKRKYHYIYKITRDDGKYYIGLHSTDDLDDGYFGSGERLWKSIHRHGKNKHTKEILEMFQSRAELIAREKELVTKELLATDNKIMNLIPGGSYFTRRPEKADAGKNRSNSLKAFYASDRSIEARKKISEANTGKTYSPESIEKYKTSAKERMKRMQEDGSWEIVKQKNALAHTGKKQSDETKHKRLVSLNKYKQQNGGKRTFSTSARINIAAAAQGNEKNAASWNLKCMSTGNTTVVKNLAKWLRENNLVRTRDGLGIKENKFRSGALLFKLERAV